LQEKIIKKVRIIKKIRKGNGRLIAENFPKLMKIPNLGFKRPIIPQ
jgi:hypothetical protein